MPLKQGLRPTTTNHTYPLVTLS